MNIIRWLRHLLCRDVVWRYPDLAALDSDPSHVYPLECTTCGHRRTITAGQLRAVKGGAA